MQEKYLTIAKQAVCNSSFEQINRYGLLMFYTGGFENIYYSENLDCFVIYKIEEDTLFLNGIIANKQINVLDVIANIAGGFKRIVLGFTPKYADKRAFELSEYDGADNYRLFYMGDSLRKIEAEKLYFPKYSHA